MLNVQYLGKAWVMFKFLIEIGIWPRNSQVLHLGKSSNWPQNLALIKDVVYSSTISSHTQT